MDTTDLKPLIEDLESNIDDLEAALKPLCAGALSTAAGKLPLLDKAKLYVLATYTIESILFSSLRLHGAEAKSHPVFQELNRVKEYFGKIKEAETAGVKPAPRLDKDAAARFVRHGLSGNDEYDRRRQQQRQREKAGAKRKLEEIAVGTHTRFDAVARREEKGEEAQMSQDKAIGRANHAGEEVTPVQRKTEGEMSKEERKAAKRQRRLEARLAKQSPAHSSAASVQEGAEIEQSGVEVSESEQQHAFRSGPRSSHGTFQALLKGPPLQEQDERQRKKKKRKSRGQIQQELEDRRAAEML